VRLQVVLDATARSLTGFVKRTVVPGALILTDGWQAFAPGTRLPPSPSHAGHQAYLDEFAFRFNRRRTPMAAFQTLLGLASGVHGPTTYDMLYRSESARARRRRRRTARARFSMLTRRAHLRSEPGGPSEGSRGVVYGAGL
jgi:hypothetical protein